MVFAYHNTHWRISTNVATAAFLCASLISSGVGVFYLRGQKLTHQVCFLSSLEGLDVSFPATCQARGQSAVISQNGAHACELSIRNVRLSDPVPYIVLQTEKSEAAKAAEMKMYGRLTREEFEWHPHNLICKRFNIPNPYPE